MVIKYRKEIDGLRALAVLPILLFHAAPAWFPGGFLGVDIFFVISGFLITSLILEESQSGTFRFIQFYERRARRILPALFVVMIFCAGIGTLFLLPDDLENLGQSMIASTLSGNNILLYLTTGYWELEAELKPLVHTWSLGVEEQFYLFAPLVLLLAKRSWIPFLLGTICVGSFAFSYVYWDRSSEFVFLMIFSRAWELGIGALATQIPKWKNSSAFATVGIILILSGFWLVGPESRHPGFPTLIPVIGTIFVILAASPTNWVGRVLSIRPLVFTGLISYSLYLWHQPMLAFFRLASLEEPSQLTLLLVASLAVIPALLSYKFIERPFRNRQRVSRTRLVQILAVTTLLMIGTGSILHYSSGHIGSKPTWASDNWTTATNASYNEEPIVYRGNAFSTDSRRKILFIGDSYARDVINMAREQGLEQSSEFLLIDTLNLCEDSFSKEHLQSIQNSDLTFVSYIGIGSQLQCFQDSTTIRPLLQPKIFFLESKNFGWSISAVMLLPEAERYPYQSKVLPWIQEENALARTLVPASQWISISALLNAPQGFMPVFTANQKLMSLDKRHLTKSGASNIGAKLFQQPQIQHILNP